MRDVMVLLRTPATVVCGVLVVLTLGSLLLGTGVSSTAAGVAVLVVAMVKVRLVGTWFMELRDAPRGLRLAFDSWCAGVGALLCVLYVVA